MDRLHSSLAAILTAFRVAICLFAIDLVAGGQASAQLRVVSYNTNFGPDADMDIVFKSIGEESRNGIAKPIDVLLLQEQDNPVPGPNSPSPTTQAYVTRLNNLYAGQGVTYAMGNLTGASSTTSDSTQTIIYRTETVVLDSEQSLGSVGGGSTQQPRATLQYTLRPVGYDSTAKFYAMNSHMKASNTATDQARRNAEAVAIRARTNSPLIGQGAHVIYAGDLNLYTAGEAAFQTLLGAGNGKAIDPLGLIDPTPDADPSDAGDWSNNSLVAFAHTQSPCISGCGDAGSGMDDRFDFQLITEEFDDDEGLDLIGGSYHPFGNNGTTYNSAINNGSNTITFPGVTSYSKSQILIALATVTDHIPVVADYQLPAVLNAIASMVPATLDLGQVFNLDLTVSNTANVLQPIGADELDYSITTTLGGALQNFSQFNQLDMALGGGNVYQIGLDTSTPGMKSDVLTIASGSQGVQNAMIQIPISFQVLAATLAGDFNDDGTVDAADYTVWRDGFGSLYDENDYVDWKNNFGQSLGSGGLAAAVPEPGSAVLVALGACLALLRPATLRAWHRKSWNRKR